MWTNLSQPQKAEYKKMILAFASLTEMFAQKVENSNAIVQPIINSKYQETVFQRVFNANAEDIGNTSYDASLIVCGSQGIQYKYLVGIKTFGYKVEAQKVAQFKQNHDEWSDIINRIKKQSQNHTKDEIDAINKELYFDLAVRIANVRNMRIDSSTANLQGFTIEEGEDNIIPVYHVLMPSKDSNVPCIYVGETSYDRIDIEHLSIIGCTSSDHPTNFIFEDGNHRYRYTSADSQLLMYFDNTNIVRERWKVEYADDAYAIFASIANQIQEKKNNAITESYSWKIEVEEFSGFNSFYGVGSKMGHDYRRTRRLNTLKKYKSVISQSDFLCLSRYMRTFFNKEVDKKKKVKIREKIIQKLSEIGNKQLENEIVKMLYRPKDEIYIPIPNSLRFHRQHPNFFGNGIGNLIANSSGSKDDKKFILVFEPSGKELECYITQDFGKAIQSTKKQSYLGEWLLRQVFRLGTYEPLTNKRLNELEINSIRLSKRSDGKIHLNFIWIDNDNIPDDYIE